MREIMKFRAWDGMNKKMSFWSMNDLCNHTDESDEKPSALEEWMQFTGLKDKHDKEIYEGDIVEYEFSPCGLQRGEFIFEDGIYFVKGTGHFRPFDCEIIGNIYQNPEFLIDSTV